MLLRFGLDIRKKVTRWVVQQWNESPRELLETPAFEIAEIWLAEAALDLI